MLPSEAQTPPTWQLVADGEAVDWRPTRAVPSDSAEAAAALALAYLHHEGYALARIDSATIAQAPTLYATRGPVAQVRRVTLEGASAVGADEFAATMATQPGDSFDREALEQDLEALLVRYERLGYPLAQVRPAITLDTDAAVPGVHVRLLVNEGDVLRLVGVELEGDRRTSGALAARVTDLQPGQPLVPYDPEAIRRALEATGLFEEVGAPVLVLSDSGAIVRVPVAEGPPGTFDLVLGYLPAADGRDGSVVGNGFIELRNLFGGGRQLRLRLIRNPGLVSSVDVRLSDPFLLGLPLRVEGQFAGYSQDSTFSRQQFRIESGYRVAPGLELIAAASREAVEPGFFGAQLVDGRPRVAASDAVFGGVGLRYRRLDIGVNPRRGLVLEALAEQGFKRRQVPATDGAGVVVPVNVRQQRLLASGRLFVPTFSRQVAVMGGEASVLLGGRAAGDDARAVYDEGDLFRLGGAASLRGYDEDRFFGTTTARALAEYRYQLDRTSFAFLFVDLGYVDRPPLPDLDAERLWLPGYGFGLQYRTPVGLVTVTYAVNPDLGLAQGKVHAGLSFGL
ncbi:MAG: BamA/TamA family outer membrane protein [Rhodothermaceae bacterium]|nr:BamA/TamA family outer membrane protein [Rhodothermaceae bacterium]